MGKWIWTGVGAVMVLWTAGCGGYGGCGAPAVRCADPCVVENGISPATPATETPVTTESSPEPEAENSPTAQTPAKEDLLHRRFALVSFDGKQFPGDHDGPTLEFQEGFRIAGKTCNRFMGPATLENGVLKSERLAGTMMLCVRPELNELEKTFNAMMTAGATVTLEDGEGGRLVLRRDGHELVYVRADWVR